MKTIAIAVFSLTLFACGGGKSGDSKEGSSSGNSLEGTWKITEAQGTGASAFIGVTCKFDATNMAMNETPYPYTISNDTITAKEIFGPVMYTYKIENNKLNLANIKNGQSWVMAKE
jgi:hypothetical protein